MPFARALTWAPALLLPALLLPAQIERSRKTENVTRAVAVYETVGDPAHPAAARLIPVSLFLNGRFEDAGVYLARPVPLALQTDTVYELQRAGIGFGTLNVEFARDRNPSSAVNGVTQATAVAARYDNSWFGYGRFSPPAAPKAARAGKGVPVTAYDPSDTATARRNQSSATAGRPGADEDPDRPAEISLPDDSKGGDKGPDPDRPTLQRSTPPAGKQKGKSPKQVNASVSETPPDPASDPDRPTVKRREGSATQTDIPPDPAELGHSKATAGREADHASAAGEASPAGETSAAGEAGTVTADPSVDPEKAKRRPVLRRGAGSAAGAGAEDGPGPAASAGGGRGRATSGSTGQPAAAAELTETVAVSDSADRPPHNFAYTFRDAAERAAAEQELRKLAQEALDKPSLATDAASLPPARPAAAARPLAPAQGRSSGVRARPGLRTAPRTLSAGDADTTLNTTDFRAFQLTFSAEPTYVYTGRAGSRSVTVVAQRDVSGSLSVAMRSISDDAHLDLVPRKRLVDVVDADASNRGVLLFELRNAASRQFELERLLGSKLDQLLLTGTMAR